MRGAGGAHIVESSEVSRACACERPSHEVPGAPLAEGGAASVARKATRAGRVAVGHAWTHRAAVRGAE